VIELMSDLPEGVLGFTASGKVTGEDYEKVVVPAVEAGLEQQPRLSLIYHLGERFTGFAAAAMWDDAKIGLKHPTAWDRVAVVTDVDWIRNATKAFGFVMPCHVRTFGNDRLAEARAWVADPAPAGLACEILAEQGVAVLTPQARLQAADFERAAAEIDRYIAEEGALQGLMIYAPSFPGWADFAGLAAHLRFVREHHRTVRRVAFVSDEGVLAHLPAIARHFVAADVRHFARDERERALAWLAERVS